MFRTPQKLIFLFILILWPSFSTAQSSLSESVISVGPPFAFAPLDFSTDDFEIKTTSTNGPSIKLVSGSMQWIRVREVLVLPRALVEIAVSDAESAEIVYQGATHPLTIDQKKGAARVLVALIDEAGNEIVARVRHGSQIQEWKWHVVFHPRKSIDRLAIDVTCARSGIQVENLSIGPDNWVYIGCGRGFGIGENAGLSPNLTLEVFVADPGNLSVNGLATQTKSHVLKLNLTHANSKVALSGSNASLTLDAHFPETFHRGTFSIGEGPYVFVFQSDTERFNGIVPVTTLYGSYWLNESMRTVFFGAVTASPQVYSDLGAYLEVETFQGLDKHFSFNLLLGAHSLIYKSQGNYYGRLDPPQGFEFVIPGVLQKNASVSGGGFIQPAINGKSYYNCWLRWGKPSYFIEANYIYWTEQTAQTFLAREVGLTFGMPLLHFF